MALGASPSTVFTFSPPRLFADATSYCVRPLKTKYVLLSPSAWPTNSRLVNSAGIRMRPPCFSATLIYTASAPRPTTGKVVRGNRRQKSRPVMACSSVLQFMKPAVLYFRNVREHKPIPPLASPRNPSKRRNHEVVGHRLLPCAAFDCLVRLI